MLVLNCFFLISGDKTIYVFTSCFAFMCLNEKYNIILFFFILFPGVEVNNLIKKKDYDAKDQNELTNNKSASHCIPHTAG